MKRSPSSPLLLVLFLFTTILALAGVPALAGEPKAAPGDAKAAAKNHPPAAPVAKTAPVAQAAQPAANASERPLDKFLYKDPAFVFQTLWRVGMIASGGGDLGEMLTVASKIKDGDTESWFQAWNAMAAKLAAIADAYAAAGRNRSAMQVYLRAAAAYKAAGVFEYGNDRGIAAWQAGRDAFLKAAAHSKGRIKPVRIPYENTTLQGYVVTPDDSATKRPVFLLQTGLDGSAEDVYFIMAAQAVERGYLCLVFEGPGQGELLMKHSVPFRPDWEKVVTPVVDFAATLPQADVTRMALIGFTMHVPRALAFEKRIKWGIADGGVLSVHGGTLALLPESMRATAGSPDHDAELNAYVANEMGKRLGFRHAMNQRLWIFKASSPGDLFRKMKPHTVEDVVGNIQADMLVVNSVADNMNDSYAQAKQFYAALKSPKTYLEFDDGLGAQFHCQVGAHLVSTEYILNWLDERAKP